MLVQEEPQNQILIKIIESPVLQEDAVGAMAQSGFEYELSRVPFLFVVAYSQTQGLSFRLHPNRILMRAPPVRTRTSFLISCLLNDPVVTLPLDLKVSEIH